MIAMEFIFLWVVQNAKFQIWPLDRYENGVKNMRFFYIKGFYTKIFSSVAEVSLSI